MYTATGRYQDEYRKAESAEDYQPVTRALSLADHPDRILLARIRSQAAAVLPLATRYMRRFLSDKPLF